MMNRKALHFLDPRLALVVLFLVSTIAPLAHDHSGESEERHENCPLCLAAHQALFDNGTSVEQHPEGTPEPLPVAYPDSAESYRYQEIDRLRAPPLT